MRQLITSDWYQKRWGDRVRLAKDQNEKLNFHNLMGGFRIATAITSLTGIRGDRVIIDDPHSVDSAASEPMRESEVSTFLEAIPTRLTNPLRSAIVVIMQRLHERDISGVIIEKGLGYDHIMLPMRFDPGRAMPTKLGLEDPRQEEGELLFPARFPQSVVDRDEKVMGPYATAGQFQQSPEPRGGGIIQRDWWQLWEDGAYPPMDFVVASLDTAYTTKQENDYSALSVWGVFTSDRSVAQPTNVARRDGEGFVANERVYVEGAPRVMLMGAWQERLELPELVQKVAESCRKMGVDRLLIESKAAGLSVSQELRRLYGHEDWAVQLINPGAIDKLARLYSVQHLFSEGMVYAPDRRWADLVIRQCEVFPKGKHDDLVDTVSMGMRHLRELGVLTRSAERMADIDEQMRHRGAPPEPLYPV
jgi:predicted phage terminase large subunit-like protein